MPCCLPAAKCQPFFGKYGKQIGQIIEYGTSLAHLGAGFQETNGDRPPAPSPLPYYAKMTLDAEKRNETQASRCFVNGLALAMV